MKIVWFLNGFFQSMTWPPMAKWISDRVDQKTCTKICLFLSTTGPVGMLCSYLISALSIKYFDWKAGFYSTAGIMLAMAVLWLGITLLLEKRGEEIQEEKVQKKADSKDGMMPLILQSGLIMVAAAAFIHGLLKDGISTWVPTYLAENYSLSSVLAIIMTMALPVINLSGVYLANWWNQWYFHTEMKTAAAFFGTTAAAVAGMSVLGKESAGISVLFFAVITTSMTAINTLLVSLVPLHFKKVNKVSTVIGVLNSVTYLGTAAGSSLFGILAERYGWGFLRAIWFIVAIVGIAVSWMGREKWNEFRGNW